MSASYPGEYRPADTSGPQRPVAVNPDPVASAPAGPTPRRAMDTGLVFAVVGLVVLAVVAVLVGAYLLFALGTTATVIASIMALVPLVVVVLVIAWIDRWEPEPRLALAFAFGWGAAASVAIALLFSFGAQLVLAFVGIGESFGAQFLSAVVQAPIVEESAKGLGVLLVFWMFRRHFEGPVDGLVYSSMVAIGFAFTENIQYFGLSLNSAELGAVAEVFFLRAVLSPFAHVMFTAFIGLALGYASRRVGRGGAVGYLLAGLIPAIALHAFWNGMSFVVANFYAYYVLVQLPFFLIAVSIVVYLRRSEQRITADRLGEYADAGWFSRAEVSLLSSPAGRRQGSAWASRHGLKAPFARFVRNSTRLAFARQRIILSRDRIAAQRAERELLDRIVEDRRALAPLPPLPVSRA